MGDLHMVSEHGNDSLSQLLLIKILWSQFSGTFDLFFIRLPVTVEFILIVALKVLCSY